MTCVGWKKRSQWEDWDLVTYLQGTIFVLKRREPAPYNVYKPFEAYNDDEYAMSHAVSIPLLAYFDVEREAQNCIIEHLISLLLEQPGYGEANQKSSGPE